jgi:excisionase family DNA binding protein
MSDSGIDAAAVREMQRLQVEVPMVCLICREEVKMIAAETAAAVCQCSRRKIYRWIEDGGLHFVEMRDGEVLVCGRSLSKKMDELDSTADKLSQRQAWAGR